MTAWVRWGDSFVIADMPMGDKHNTPKVITNHPNLNTFKEV